MTRSVTEKAIRKYVKGRGAVREWVKLRERNEALDLEVYALAALHVLGPNFVHDLARRAATFSKPLEEGAPPRPTASAESPAPSAHWPAWPRPRRSSWIEKCLPPSRRGRW